MREYVLTSHERDVIEAYKKGEIRYGFYALRSRGKDVLPRIRSDVELIESILKKKEKRG